MLVAVAGADALFDEHRGDEGDRPIYRPTRHRIGSTQPCQEVRELTPAKIRPYPMRSGAEYDPADPAGGRRRHIAKLALAAAGMEHRVRLSGQARFRPVINL